MQTEKNCTLLLHYDKNTPPNEEEIREELEAKEVDRKISGLKTLISLQLNGEMMPKLLMTVIRFCVPCDDHKIKKLMLIYWEVIDKTGADGKLLPEMILVCNNLRNDLIHPNEYIRGCTLRFICKLKEAEILEPLIPTIKNNLEHRHSFVRRNAVLAVFSIYKGFDQLIPDGPELVEKVLQTEADASCKRNAFLMLFQCAQERAVAYLSENLDQVSNWSDILQLVVLELIRKVVRANPYEKSKYIRCILTLFNSPSNAVAYECASALVALTSSPTAIKAAANSYTQLLSSQSDNNIKLIVLERLQDLKRQHPKIMQGMVMDIMRALTSANLEIRKKTLSIALDLIVPQNISEVMQVLKKEVQKTQGEDGEKHAEYRALLISTIHSAAIKFPDTAAMVVPVLMEFLGEPNQTSAVDVVLFVREIVETYPQLQDSIMKKLLQTFPTIQSSRVARVALWLLGEYCSEAEEVALTFTTLKACLGELPFLAEGEEAEVPQCAPQPRAEGRPVVLPDGSYATQTAQEDTVASVPGVPKLRGLLLGGDFFLATVVATTLTKLALRSTKHVPSNTANLVLADVMLLLTGLLQLGKAGQCSQSIDADSQERISMYLHLLSNPAPEVEHLFLVHCRKAFAAMLSERQAAEAIDRPAEDAAPEVARQADDLILVRQLRGRGGEVNSIDLDDDDDMLTKVTGGVSKDDFSSRLKRVTQLTGLSDPVYAEAYVTVHSYDILLEVLLINQTTESMHNLCLELAVVGDLKLCERPQPYLLAPGESKHVKANIKVSSTETGIVFGSIVYDAKGDGQPSAQDADRNCVVLNDIHIDIMDYISPANCSDLTFRAMWAEFEWENKAMRTC
jgi:coatomer subunit beta